MLTIQELTIPGYTKVIEGQDPAAGLHCFIAIHSTQLGPALGGVRIYPYPDQASALNDALRLARAMTYKTALAQIGLGGGKSVIIAPADYPARREVLLKAFAAVVDSLQGMYIAAEDVGSSLEDMVVLRSITPYVSALPTATSSGDPSRFTAWGIGRGLAAVAETLWGTPSLRERTVAIQGLGHVGAKVADVLFWQGANLLLCDRRTSLAQELCHLYGAELITPEAFCSTSCDILCPCALGGILNATTIPTLRCCAVAGGANNQLETAHDANLLYARSILYAPDYVINAGGIVNACAEFNLTGYDPHWALAHTEDIYLLLKEIFEQSRLQNLPTDTIATALAEERLASGSGKRTVPLRFH